jgi:hypothetical protein
MSSSVFPVPSSSGVNYNGGVEANRPADPAAGTTYFNTDLTAIEIYNGTDWQVITQPSGLPEFVTASGSLGDVNEQTALIGQFTVEATDPEGGAITYTLKDDDPAWLSIGSTSGVLSGTTPSVTTDTVVSFAIRATDAFGFFADRTFSIEVKDAIFIEYVILAGGGGGGGGELNSAGDGGGGGGGGGYITGNTAVEKVTHTVVIGAGGAGQAGSPAQGSADNGVLSRIHIDGATVSGLTVNGGGGGGGNDGEGQDGGCGGGQSGDAGGAGGVGDPGFDGGAAGGGRSGGGGGGMSAVGTAVLGGGSGGAGVTDPIKSIAVGGGGAGGRGSNTTQVGVGATAFGGANDGNNGTANTGGGGGAGQSGGNTGGSGGSGRIIIKTLSEASATTGSPTVTTSGSYHIYDYTASGSITWS